MEDHSVAQVAAYLHVSPAQVIKMASRGLLPGRRVGGEWVFNQAEIHHWLEEKIGASDSEELTKVQSMVDRVTDHSGERI